MTLHTPEATRHRVFRAGPIQFDESRMDLLVDGQRRTVEAKPLALLQALLTRAGAVTTKRALIEAAWGNADHISEASLTTAISKLRAALGDKARDLIDAVPGIGYRIAAEVEVIAASGALAFAFRPGDPVPGRPQWLLDRVLGPGLLRDVWLARHGKTGETRVFKFADSEARLETLRREASLSRVLHATLGPRDDLVRIVEWNFDTRPYFIESPFGGLDLPGWAETKGGLAAVPLATRLSLLARLARTVAAAHAAGVLHGDIKPANILVADAPHGPGQEHGREHAQDHGQEHGPPLIRLVDFGAGEMSDPARLAALSITLQSGADGPERGTGTLRYMAPEVLAGHPPTTAADIFALGILLYQMVTGDSARSLSVGWEADVDDALLRQDIQDAAAGDPARRLGSAAALADRLETLDARRAAQQCRIEEAAHAARLARAVERERLRRPWIAAAALSMAAGLALSTLFGLRALHDRDEARRRAELAQAVNSFLTEDLLGRGNPANSGKANETLMDAAQAAEAGIDRRLSAEPMVAGAIYLSLARVFDSRSAYDAARNAYEHAAGAFLKAGPPGLAKAVIARLQQGAMVAVSGQPGSLVQARRVIASAAAQVAALGPRQAEAQVWLDNASAALEMLGGNVQTAQTDYTEAAEAAEAMPAVFDEGTRLELRQRQAFTSLRLGEWPRAETMFAALLQRRLVLNGPRHPDTLETELNLARVRVAEGRPADALASLDRVAPDFAAVFGPDHRKSMLLLATRAQALMQVERYPEAIADEQTLYRLAVAKEGGRSFFALGTLSDMAGAQCRAGQIEAGLASAQAAYVGILAAYGPAAGITQFTAGALAFCEILAGRNDAALARLQAIDRRTVGQMTIDPDYGGDLDLMIAAAALGMGDRGRAAALLNKVSPVFQRPGADGYMRRWLSRLRQDGKVGGNVPSPPNPSSVLKE